MSAAYDLARGVTVVFGGWNGTVLGDLWEWNGTAWTQRSSPVAPPARCCHALAFDFGRGRLVVFGGAGPGLVDLDDTWEWDGQVWSQASPAVRPLPRRMSALAFDPATGAMLLFGGGVTGSGTTMFGDTWSWNGTQWTPLAPPVAPPARWSHAMASDLGRREIVLFGGTRQFSWLGGTWVWNGSTWRQNGGVQADQTQRAAMAADPTRGLLLTHLPSGGTWVQDGQNWHALGVTGPSGRESQGMAYDLQRDRVVLFGGWGNNALGETWEFDFSGLGWWRADGVGCAGNLGVSQLAATSRPLIGRSLVMTASAAPTWVVFALGQTATQWNGSPLPLSLTGFGMPGCDLAMAPEHLSFATASGGAASIAWTVPMSPALVGGVLFAQALVSAPGTNAAGAVVSNTGRLVIGSF
ncbi:MAG: hypothetical protein IPK26_03270 [Planctomycetes bacterium]|nr:hypothetical protein [Planctomycetota bacterium]